MGEGDCMCCVPERHRDKRWVKLLMDNLLIIFIVIGVCVGLGLGLGLRGHWGHDELAKIWYLGFPGRLLLNMLKMLILPLIVSSLITGLTGLSSSAQVLKSSKDSISSMSKAESSAVSRLVAASVAYYIVTTLVAVFLGILLVLTLSPGSHSNKDELGGGGGTAAVGEPMDAILDLITNAFPDNLVTACFERKRTVIGEKIFLKPNRSNKGELIEYAVANPRQELSSGTNTLGMVVFSIAFGAILNGLQEAQAKPLIDFFNSLNFATMRLINVVIWFTPIGLVFLVADKFVRTEDLAGILQDLGFYFLTVLAGLFIHGLVVLPALFFLVTRKNPFVFFLNMSKAILTAWGTASSSATLPITMDCLVNKNRVNIDIVRFVAPVGATINMDGTALYEAVACIFIAQVNGIDLGFADIIIVSLTATAAAIGAAGVPQAGLVTMVMVLDAVGLPEEDISLILAIDWLLDRFRTAVNVWGDSIGAGIIDHLFSHLFKKAEVSLVEPIVETCDDIEYYKPSNEGLEESYANEEKNGTTTVEEKSQRTDRGSYSQ